MSKVTPLPFTLSNVMNSRVGFYVELYPDSNHPNAYRESGVPPVFWTLFGIAGFALSCMWGAAHQTLLQLSKSGHWFDEAIVWIFISAIPVYLGFGIKFAWVRKFIEFPDTALRIGFRLGRFPLIFRNISKSDIDTFEILNNRPTSNLAPSQHDDSQYYYQGHWQLRCKLKNGKSLSIDKNTHKEILFPLYNDLCRWLAQ